MGYISYNIFLLLIGFNVRNVCMSAFSTPLKKCHFPLKKVAEILSYVKKIYLCKAFERYESGRWIQGLRRQYPRIAESEHIGCGTETKELIGC